jgi:two-component sensor histidine kinase
MANVEEFIYETGDLDEESFRTFLDNLFSSVATRYGSGRFSAGYKIDLGENGRFPHGTAMPLALIVNELVQNACRHGASPAGGIELTIGLVRTQDGKITLTVRDRGAGFARNPTEKQSGSFGFTLIETLVSQIGGRVDCANEGGAVVRVEF